MCRNIKNDNITVYTIAYEVNDTRITVYTIAYEVNDTRTENLLRNCASQAGNYFDASSAQELREAFDVIATSLTELRITV